MSTARFNTWQNPDGTENYKCRAWVNFNGTGTIAIRASGNVSSITDVTTGDYQVNFINAMADTSFAWVGSARIDNTAADANFPLVGESRQTRAAGSIRIYTCFRGVATTTTALQDCDIVSVAVFR